MSKDTQQPGKEAIHSVRIRIGGVHFTGARIITTLTTEPSANLFGSNTVACDEIRFHPAGISFVASPSDGGGTHVIPYANIEVINLA